MAEKIADYFGSLGFQVNDKGLKEFIKKLEDVAKKMQGLTKAAAGASPLAKVADGMQEIGAKAKVAADVVDKAAEKIVKSNKKITQSQIKEQQKLDAALRRGNASNPLTEVQQKMRTLTAKRAAAQSSGNAAEQARLDAWFVQAQRKEQALMKSSAAAYRRSSALGNSVVGRAVMGVNKNVASRQAADAAELARYEAWFGKAESRDASLGIAEGRGYRRSRATGDRTISQVRADILAAKALREKRDAVDAAVRDRESARTLRRQERMTSEDERRYQNRVSRTYAPKTSRLDLYQKDLARTQMMYNAALVAGDGSAKRYAEAIKKLRSEITSLNRQTMFGKMGLKSFGGFGLGGLGSALVPMLGMAAAGGAAGFGYGITALNNQLVQQQSVQAQFQGLYGNAQAGEQGYKQYMDFANLRGIRGMQNAQDYLNFMYAGSSKIGTEGTNKIFQSFTELAKVRGTSGERYQRALTALGQMLSKGKLQAEEVKGQFSEHVGGGLDIFAQAITGKTGAAATTEFMDGMKKGLYDSAKWLPIVAEKMRQVAKEAGTLDQMSNNLDSSLARMNNKWADFTKRLEEAGVAAAMGRFIEMLTGKLESLSDIVIENKDVLVGLIDAFTSFVDFITSKEFVLVGLTATFTALGAAIKTNAVWMGILTGPATLAGIGSLIKAMWSLAAVQAVAFAPWLWLAAMIATTLLVLEDFYYWVNGKPSLMGELFGDADDMFKGLDQFFDDMKKKWDEVTTEMSKMWEKFKSTVSKPFNWLGKKWDDVSKGAGEMMNDMGIRTSIVANAPMVTGQQTKPVPTYQLNGVTINANDPMALGRALQQETSKYSIGVPR